MSIMLSPNPQVESLISAYRESNKDGLSGGNNKPSPAEKLASELAKNREEGVREIRRLLSNSISAALQIDEVDVEGIIQEIGVDSMTSLQASAKLQNALVVKVSAMQLLGNQAVASLSEDTAMGIEATHNSQATIEEEKKMLLIGFDAIDNTLSK